MDAKPLEVYWLDADGDLRGQKFADEAMARGFIVGLRKDTRNADIFGMSRGDSLFNTDEFGEPCDHLGGFPPLPRRRA